jgi:hypothetical protein
MPHRLEQSREDLKDVLPPQHKFVDLLDGDTTEHSHLLHHAAPIAQALLQLTSDPRPQLRLIHLNVALKQNDP